MAKKSKKNKIEMPSLNWANDGPPRFICDVLEGMRKCVETLNFSPLLSYIEEAQYLASNMENALSNIKTLRELYEDISKLKKVKKELVKEVQELIDKQ